MYQNAAISFPCPISLSHSLERRDASDIYISGSQFVCFRLERLSEDGEGAYSMLRMRERKRTFHREKDLEMKEISLSHFKYFLSLLFFLLSLSCSTFRIQMCSPLCKFCKETQTGAFELGIGDISKNISLTWTHFSLLLWLKFYQSTTQYCWMK